jgi:hypothetical protein
VSESSNKFNHDAPIIVIAPEAPTTSGGTPPSESAIDKKKMSLKKKLLIGSAGIALTAVVGTGIGLGMVKGGNKTPQDTTSSVPATPEVTTNPVDKKGNNVTPEYQFTSESISIPSGLSDQEYATRVFDVFTKWDMAGANDANYDKWLNSGMSLSFPNEIATENKTIVEKSNFFSKRAFNNSNLEVFSNVEPLANEGYIHSWLVTYNKPGNKPALGQTEAFNTTNSMDSVINNNIAPGSGGRTLTIHGTQHNNSEKNAISAHQNIVEEDGQEFTYIITTVTEGGFEEIDSLRNK